MAKIISVSLVKEDEERLLSLMKKNSFNGKSEVFRAALRSLEKEYSSLSTKKGKCDAVLTVTHQNHSFVSKILHSNENIVRAHLHQHISDKCVEIVLVKGTSTQLQNLLGILSKDKGICDMKLLQI